jgi:hypothetical protein
MNWNPSSISSWISFGVLDCIGKWQGETFGPAKSWVEDETRDFDEASITAAQLTLLIAKVPSQLDENTILRFR